MRTLLLSIATLGGLVGACALPAAAAPVVPGIHASAAPSIQRVDYYWRHRHYHHRNWDRRHHRWRYY
ncbi:MAG: hypothetical protein ABI369_14750 [Acetobacteraceae bacterium]